MKTLKFAPHLVELVLSGAKTTTWRLFDDKDLMEGDEITFINKETGEVFGIGVLNQVNVRTLGTLTDEDWAGHERFSSDEAMYAQYQKYYPKESVGPGTEVKILFFTFTPSGVVA